MDEIIIDIDCYNCGFKIQFSFKLLLTHVEHIHCNSCREGIQVYFDQYGLHIDRLEQE